MRVVHCYGQTPLMQRAIDDHFDWLYRLKGWYFGREFGRDDFGYHRYEKERAWQPTVCGLRISDKDVVRPSDFVAVVNHTDPDIDMTPCDDSGREALPYQAGDFIPDVEPCGICKEAAPESWPYLSYAPTREEACHESL